VCGQFAIWKIVWEYYRVVSPFPFLGGVPSASVYKGEDVDVRSTMFGKLLKVRSKNVCVLF
jgi:hypothetical protein